MTLCRLVAMVFGLIAMGTQGYSPSSVPIKWMQSKARGFVLRPSGFVSHSQDYVPPHDLIIQNPFDSMSSDIIPHFTANPDETITLDGTGLCIEAVGTETGDVARMNWCKSGPAEKWRVIAAGNGRNQIQLKDTDKCLGAIAKGESLNGAPIGLRECAEETKSWTFGERVPLSSGSHSVKEKYSSAMQHLVISLIALSGLAASTLGAWLLVWRAKLRAEGGESSNMDQEGGVYLTAPHSGCSINEGIGPKLNMARFPVTAGGDHQARTINMRCRARPVMTAVAGPTSVFGPTFFGSAGIFTGATLLGFVISALTGTHVHLDLIGTGVFAVAGLAVGSPGLSGKCMAIWAGRLATFLFYRACMTGHDARLDKLLSGIPGAAAFWLISLAWNILTSLPHTLAGPVGITSKLLVRICRTLGITAFVTGLSIECIADLQKWFFKNSNAGKLCNVGLWSVSQHPNYFGNLLLWIGIFVMNAPALIDPVIGTSSPWNLRRYRRLILSVACPAFLFVLFSGQASGAIGEGKAQADARYGLDPAYQGYIRTVPQLFPNPIALLKALARSFVGSW